MIIFKINLIDYIFKWGLVKQTIDIRYNKLNSMEQDESCTKNKKNIISISISISNSNTIRTTKDIYIFITLGSITTKQ